MPKIKFSKQVWARTLVPKLRKDIIEAAASSPQFRKEISRVFQQANRRIQNIEKAGLLSPAVASLNKDAISGYTKFSTRDMSWEELKIEYGKAISFLKQPTSTAQGTRQYNKHLQQTYALSPEEFDLMAQSLNNKLKSLKDSDFVERYLMRYKDFTGELEQSAADISTQLESEAQRIERAIEADVDEAVEQALIEIEDTHESIQRIIESFNKFRL